MTTITTAKAREIAHYMNTTVHDIRALAISRGVTIDDTARVQAMIDAQQPITHAAILAAVKRLPDNLDGPAAIADALCAQLGVDVPVKVAPWEVALDDWQAARNSPGGAEPDYSVKGTWQAAVEWCVEQIADAHGFTPHDVRDTIRRRIIREQP